ncbi:hypothetical protein C0989_010136, partial [Termitomyces sp. Mn162]
MSAFNPTYNPVGYPTNAYGRPILKNSYAPFYPGPFADQYVPRHWTPDPNQAFYAPSISQGIPLGWRRPPAFHADGNNPRINPGGYSAAPPNASATLEVWADQLLDFHKRYLQGNLPENTQGTLGIDNNLRNELHTLVEEIHTSPNPRPFEDPLDPTHSFHVQCKEPVRTRNKAPSSVPCQQEELNAASSILRNLNPAGGLFDQPAAHTLALSAQPRASSVPSAFRTWDQPAAPELCSQRPPLRVDNNNRILSYIDKPGNPANKHPPRNGPQRDRPPHFDLRAPCSNAPLPRPNAPVPPRQPMGPG